MKWGPGAVHTQSLEMLGLEKKKDKTLIWIPRPLPEHWSQTLRGAGARNLHSTQPSKQSPTRHSKVQSVSITLGWEWREGTAAAPPLCPPVLNTGNQTAGPGAQRTEEDKTWSPWQVSCVRRPELKGRKGKWFFH